MEMPNLAYYFFVFWTMLEVAVLLQCLDSIDRLACGPVLRLLVSGIKSCPGVGRVRIRVLIGSWIKIL